MVASGLADAGYMFVLGCSRFRLHALVTVTTAWLYAGAITLTAVTDGADGRLGGGHLGRLPGGQGRRCCSAPASGPRALAAPDRRLLRESIAFGVRAWIGTLSSAFNERVDQILVALIASEAALGLYATAVNGFEILLYPAGAVATAILPLAARAYPADRAARVRAGVPGGGAADADRHGGRGRPRPAADPAGLRRGLRRVGRAVPLAAPGAIGFVALAIFSNALVASSAPGRSSAGPLVSLTLGVVLDLVLIPPYGATGAAAAAAGGLLAGGATALVLYRRLERFPPRDAVRARARRPGPAPGPGAT